MDTNLLQLVAFLLISILALILGVSVFIADKRSKTNRSYFITALAVVLWITFGFLVYYHPLQHFAPIFGRLNFAFVALFGVSVYVFISNFPSPKTKFSFLDFLIIGVGFLFSALSIFTKLVVANVQTEGFLKVWQYGEYSNYFYAYIILVALLIIYHLVKKYIEKPADKAKIIFFVYGAIIVFIFNAIFNVLFPALFSNDKYYWLGDYSIIFFLIFTAYAIVKHQLFNIKVIATQTAAVVINIVLIIQVFNSSSTTEAVLTAFFWLIVLYGSYQLVKSVQREIKFREELQQLSEQLAHANGHLKELDQMKTEFVSLASHELLTPVSAIEGYLSMLLDEKIAEVKDPKAMKYLTNVYSSAKRLARLVADMLNISRIEEGRLLVEKKDLDLSKVINEVISEIKFKADERKQRIVFENDEIRNPKSETISNDQNQKFETYGDQDKIKEVVINIIGNSIKYSKNPGTITIKIEKVPTAWVSEKWQKIEEDIKERPLDDQEAIKSAVDPHFRDFVGENQLLISVQDQGIGIPKDELPRLFKKFHRVGDFTTAESQGSGLGLYISRALVELHHGRIWASSEGPSRGSTFTFSLPELAKKDEILKMEAQADIKKEQLKPLARPVKEAEEI